MSGDVVAEYSASMLLCVIVSVIGGFFVLMYDVATTLVSRWHSKIICEMLMENDISGGLK